MRVVALLKFVQTLVNQTFVALSALSAPHVWQQFWVEFSPHQNYTTVSLDDLLEPAAYRDILIFEDLTLFALHHHMTALESVHLHDGSNDDRFIIGFSDLPLKRRWLWCLNPLTERLYHLEWTHWEFDTINPETSENVNRQIRHFVKVRENKPTIVTTVISTASGNKQWKEESRQSSYRADPEMIYRLRSNLLIELRTIEH